MIPTGNNLTAPVLDCGSRGHAAPLVRHLPDWCTRITCPRCGKSVIERGLSDHPDVAKKEPE